MYVLFVKDYAFNELEFKFSSMEELGIFASTVLATSVKDVEIIIKKEVNEDVIGEAN